MRHEVAVVGLGAMGSAVLYQLARRGVDAIGLDAHTPPHEHGSTHGETRITRVGLGEGRALVPLVRRSHAIWRGLEAATGQALFTACGALVIGRREGFLARTIAVAEAAGVSHELLDRAALARRFPQFTGIGEDEIGYLEADAGFVSPEACVAAQLGEAARLGATIRTGVQVASVRQAGQGVAIETDAGTVQADRAIVAAGPWTAALLGPPFDRLLRVTRQALFWFKAEGLADAPVFIRVHGPGDEGFYGFPAIDGAVKLATESEAAIDPARYRPGEAAPGEAAAFFAHHVAGRLAGVSNQVLRSRTCLYTSTADGRFLIGPHPAMPRVTVVSACSGHGFKHSAGIGEVVAGRVQADLRLAPFALA